MPFAIALFAKSELTLPIALVRDDRIRAALFQRCAQLGAVVGFIAEQRLAGFGLQDQFGAGRAVMRLSASPPVSIIVRRRPLASPIAWIFVFLPPRDRPTA